jgi:hypothetical protein
VGGVNNVWHATVFFEADTACPCHIMLASPPRGIYVAKATMHV